MPALDSIALRGASHARDEQHAVEELRRAIHLTDPALVTFFCSPRFDRDRLASALRRAFPCPVVGCTTAGEITHEGYLEGTLTGFSLSRSAFRATPTLIEGLDRFDTHRAQELVARVAPEPAAGDWKRLGLIFMDGLALKEERTVANLHLATGGMTLVGGSAGDGLDFRQTWVYGDGRFVQNAGVYTVLETALPFRAFKQQHFRPTDRKLVITEALPEQRLVTEIDGIAAAEAYAEALGITTADLGHAVFSEHPLILHMGGADYVRSIQRVTPEGWLGFYCAIDTGLVLTIGEGVGLERSLEAQLKSLDDEIGPLSLVLGSDCILRRLECEAKGLKDRVRDVLAPYPFIGFSTYGEQIHGIHVNQTLTGVAFGTPA